MSRVIFGSGGYFGNEREGSRLGLVAALQKKGARFDELSAAGGDRILCRRNLVGRLSRLHGKKDAADSRKRQAKLGKDRQRRNGARGDYVVFLAVRG